jgi:hypothetical protein
MSTDYFLAKGSHSTEADGRCAMEWVAYVAGEPHSDRPVCVSPVLQTFCIRLNDTLDDQTRQRLRPYLGRCIGTAGDGRDEERAWMCADWLLREYVPAFLDAAKLHEQAQNMRSLAAVVDLPSLQAAKPTLNGARRDAAVAWAAAWDAAGDAAWAAAWDVAWAAARDAAGDAARDAARAALKPTVVKLQDSAFDLLDRMLPKELVELPELQVCRLREVEGAAV